jgi:hypothetical protein
VTSPALLSWLLFCQFLGLVFAKVFKGEIKRDPLKKKFIKAQNQQLSSSQIWHFRGKTHALVCDLLK